MAEKRDALLNKNNEIAINQHKELMKFNRLKLAIYKEFKLQECRDRARDYDLKIKMAAFRDKNGDSKAGIIAHLSGFKVFDNFCYKVKW